MADLTQTFRGNLVGCEARTYDGFKDGDGKEVQGGVRRSVWLSQAFDQAPIEIRAFGGQEGTFESLRKLGQGALIEVVAELRAQNNKLTLRMQSARALTPATAGK
jgi:hypothetical protein